MKTITFTFLLPLKKSYIKNIVKNVLQRSHEWLARLPASTIQALGLIQDMSGTLRGDSLVNCSDEDKPQSTYIGRDETRLVYRPTQLERTPQLYW
jgi:hypothetical protein